MTASEKIKAIDTNIEQNKAQYKLDRETAKNVALQSGNVCKYDIKCSFTDYSNTGKYYAFSFTTQYNTLLQFYHQLNNFRNLKMKKPKIKKRVYRNAVKLYNALLAIYFINENSITNKKNKDKIYDPSNLFLKGYKYDKW